MLHLMKACQHLEEKLDYLIQIREFCKLISVNEMNVNLYIVVGQFKCI
jgi:hypothetical protein